MMASHCVVCGAVPWLDSLETARVPSNVRAFRHETFEVWRCPSCDSLHASREVDLGHYYAGYPFHGAGEDPRLSLVYGNLLRRLRRAGLERTHRILDYGCGSGAFVAFLRARGYAHAFGFDAYSPTFSDRAVLKEEYDCIVGQDVLEHVPSPRELLRSFYAWSKPGALLSIGTPDASRIDLKRPHDFVHALHLPFHRHILSLSALTRVAAVVGFRRERVYRTMYTNTLVPGFNEAFYRHYARLLDDTLDAILGPVALRPLLKELPRTLWLAFFGAFFSRGTDPTVIFRRS
jgi:SAM-dependent methyltransferase